MLKTNITDGRGSGNSASVEDEALVVTQYTCPPMIPQKNKIFRQYLTDDGLSTGNSSMLVDGSTTSAEFYVQADADDDRYITAINFEVSDDGSKLKFFGATNILTNGCILCYERDLEIIFIHSAIKTNWDLMRMGLVKNSPLVEIKPSKDVNAKVDAFISVIDFTALMPPYGIKLDRGTKQRLVLTVQDDLTAANMPDTFDGIAYGFDRFE